MRSVSVIALLLAGTLAAFAQSSPTAGQPVKPQAVQSAKSTKRPAILSARQTYDAMSNAERIAIQSDLIWTSDYSDIANGEFGDRAVTAVKSFQKTLGGKETGVLNLQERIQLAELSKSRQEAAGWKIIADPATGARLGLPTKIVPQTAETKIGSRWQSARGEAQVETFRINAPGTTLAAVYERQKKEPPNRQIEYNMLKPDFFVMSGLQGLKKFYVRAHILDGDVRGLTILYDQAMEGIMDPITVAMSSAFVPFPAAKDAAGTPAKRKVDYATGIEVSAAGHIVTDRAMTEDCNVIAVPGIGNAERIADDKESGLALLRLNGAGNLRPVAVGNDATRPGDLTLVGIADPQVQDGGSAVTTAKAKLAANSLAGAIDPAPAPGFSGAAAIDGDGRFVGMVQLKPRAVAGPATTATQAVLVDVVTVRHFLDAQKVDTTTGSTGIENAKTAVVRVICVRK
jgi:peptidoglycan hydrolase-like protein with peptidoglycan-binding domain